MKINAIKGASDQNKEEWLAERLGGITATEIKTLFLADEAGNLDQAIQEMVIKKIINASTPDNKFFIWGREREPIIAKKIQNMFPSFKLEEEHCVYHSLEDYKFMASPDMIGEKDDNPFLVEIKTSKNDLMDEQVLDKTGYFYQCQWQMFVTQTVECWLVFEQHSGIWQEGADGIERPSEVYPLQYIGFVRNDEVIGKMKHIANLFLSAYLPAISWGIAKPQ